MEIRKSFYFKVHSEEYSHHNNGTVDDCTVLKYNNKIKVMDIFILLLIMYLFILLENEMKMKDVINKNLSLFKLAHKIYVLIVTCK